LLEDAMHEAQRVLPLAVASYDDTRGATLLTHCFNYVRWKVWQMLRYAWKREQSVTRSWGEMAERMRVHLESLPDDRVQYVLDSVTPDDAELLRWRFMHAMEYREIGEMLECSASSAHAAVQRALEAARAVAEKMSDDDRET
jgi:DNA-directed RNA polymerase specialized sigma24 family protein